MSINEKVLKVKEDSQSLCLQLRTSWDEYRNLQTQDKMIGLTFVHTREQEADKDSQYSGFVCGGSFAGDQLYVFSQGNGTLTAITNHEGKDAEPITSVFSLAQAPKI